MSEWAFRQMEPGDTGKVISSWLVSYADVPVIRDYIKHVHRGDRDAYFAGYEPTVKAILERSTVVVAYFPEAPSSVIGWMAVEEPDILHYVWVKNTVRRLGLARHLLSGLEGRQMVTTHVVHRRALSERLPRCWTYKPWYRWPDGIGSSLDPKDKRNINRLLHGEESR